MADQLEHRNSLERVEAWVASTTPNRDGERMLERARSMEPAELEEFADFLDELPW